MSIVDGILGGLALYWTSSVQYRALRAGARLCHLIGHGTNGHTYAGVASIGLEYAQVSTLSPWVLGN
jgi:hypothetical protein